MECIQLSSPSLDTLLTPYHMRIYSRIFQLQLRVALAVCALTTQMGVMRQLAGQTCGVHIALLALRYTLLHVLMHARQQMIVLVCSEVLCGGERCAQLDTTLRTQWSTLGAQMSVSRARQTHNAHVHELMHVCLMHADEQQLSTTITTSTVDHVVWQALKRLAAMAHCVADMLAHCCEHPDAPDGVE
jgi:hypothetical protein